MNNYDVNISINFYGNDDDYADNCNDNYNTDITDCRHNRIK